MANARQAAGEKGSQVKMHLTREERGPGMTILLWILE